MWKLFESIRGALKIDEVQVDNDVFRLHYKVTAVLLAAFSALVTAKQYIGDPIDCTMGNVNDKDAKVYDTYCWIQTTFSVVKAFGPNTDDNNAYPGVGTHSDTDELVYHKYYQWVCFFLFLQAIMFYIPRYVWKQWENGRCKKLVEGLSGPLVDDPSIVNIRLESLVRFLLRNLGHQRQYAYRFFFCEVLNLVNVIGQIYFTDMFLGYEFTTYGVNVIQSMLAPLDKRTDPMSMVFPKLTKCTFYSYGYSGTIQRRDGLCVLSLNVLNEKIFLFTFCWFIILAVVTGIGAIYRIVTVLSVRVRCHMLRRDTSFVHESDMLFIEGRLDLGDWFVISQLNKNMDTITFRDFITFLANKLRSANDEMPNLKDFGTQCCRTSKRLN